MSNSIKILMLAAFASIFFACKKDEDPTGGIIGPVPELALLNVSPTNVVALEDSIVFMVEYTDGDGDLGFQDADSMSIFLTDIRIPITEGYHLSPLAPIGSGITIQGVLPVVLDRTILVDPTATSETVEFEIKIKDRAGNWSNTIVSPPITVTAE